VDVAIIWCIFVAVDEEDAAVAVALCIVFERTDKPPTDDEDKDKDDDKDIQQFSAMRDKWYISRGGPNRITKVEVEERKDRMKFLFFFRLNDESFVLRFLNQKRPLNSEVRKYHFSSTVANNNDSLIK